MKMKLSSFALLIATATASQGNGSPSQSNKKNYPAPPNAICLNQADFNQGTKIISSPGVYKLCEDISFGPNGPAPDQLPEENAFDPDYIGEYSTNEFGLGFFAAICIASSDVTIYLNKFTIEQSAGHALMQRFFSVFELSSSPFIPSVGPAQFVGEGEDFAPASNVKILGPGVIGRSSHHGIHGNENKNVKIAAVEFRDFEVAAVSLNNVDSLEISDNNIVRNRADVPVVGLFSAARFIRPYGKYLKEQGFEMDLYDSKTGMIKMKSAADAYDNLITSIKNVYEDVILGDNNGRINKDTHPEEYHLFDNPFNVVDGPCYAFVVHGKGPAVGGQGDFFNEDETVTSSNVVIKDNTIDNIKCWNNEVPALSRTSDGIDYKVNDARGAIFQTIKTFDSENPYLAMDEDGIYNGNVVSDMQIMVAQGIISGVIPSIPNRQTGPSSIDQGIIDWAKGGSTMVPQYICNGDSMHHVVKGIIAIRVEDTAGFNIVNNEIKSITNLSVGPFSNCFRYHAGASFENTDQSQAGNVRAISVAAVRGFDNTHSQINDNIIGGVSSEEASVIIGIDVQGDSQNTEIVGNSVDLQENLFQGSTCDNCIALRVREAVGGLITLQDNNLVQEVQLLNSNSIRGRARGLKKLHSHMSGYDEWQPEWSLGGCPYANQ